MTEAEKQAIEKLHNGKKMDLISIIRTFKREGIENFVVTKKETVETVLNLIEKQQEEIRQYEKALHDQIIKGCEIELALKEEIEKKDKMAIALFDEWYMPELNTTEKLKEYFKKKVESKDE